MNCGTIKSDYIRQNGQHCGYIIMQYTVCEYWIELYLFNISGCVIRIKETDREKAEKAFSDMLAEYCY